MKGGEYKFDCYTSRTGVSEEVMYDGGETCRVPNVSTEMTLWDRASKGKLMPFPQGLILKHCSKDISFPLTALLPKSHFYISAVCTHSGNNALHDSGQNQGLQRWQSVRSKS